MIPVINAAKQENSGKSLRRKSKLPPPLYLALCNGSSFVEFAVSDTGMTAELPQPRSASAAPGSALPSPASWRA
jgi:hypothetical protein